MIVFTTTSVYICTWLLQAILFFFSHIKDIVWFNGKKKMQWLMLGAFISVLACCPATDVVGTFESTFHVELLPYIVFVLHLFIFDIFFF